MRSIRASVEAYIGMIGQIHSNFIRVHRVARH
jgi:hypothetical protein